MTIEIIINNTLYRFHMSQEDIFHMSQEDIQAYEAALLQARQAWRALLAQQFPPEQGTDSATEDALAEDSQRLADKWRTYNG